MDDVLARFVSDLVGRTQGPLHLRFLMQPAMAMAYAIRDGLKDAREDRPAYFWTIFRDREQRHALLHEGWKAMARVMGLGAVMDTLYQLFVFKWIYPLQVVVIVLALAFVPYLLLRGPVNRIVRQWILRRVRAG